MSKNVSDYPVGTDLHCELGMRGEVVAHGAFRFVVCTQGGSLYIIHPHSLLDQDGDRWSTDATTTETSEWINIYNDGTTGGTTWRSADEALRLSAYNKVRVGLLENVRDRCGDVIRSRVLPTVPQLRNRDNPTGVNPYA